MRIHEYQAKQLFAKYGIPIAASKIAATIEDAVVAAEELGFPVVVKAQIHTGGQGKGGGIQLAKDSAQVNDAATRMLEMLLITPQTDSAGSIVHTLLIESASDVPRFA